MITVDNLTKVYRTAEKSNNAFERLFKRKYKTSLAVDNISFHIEKNELVGFIGPNGAGKTTTLKILAGVLFPTSGEIKVMGQVPFDKKPDFLKNISFVMGQRNQLIWDLPALDTFRLNKEIYDIPEAGFKRTVDELSNLLNCSHLLNKPVKTLSLGERMKMELIAALVHRPKVIFFDEPTIGLDIFSQDVIRDFIKKYQKEFGTTIMLTSHYLEDVRRLASRLIIIDKGHILYDGSLKNLYAKFSRHKKVKIILDHDVPKSLLEKTGHLTGYAFPKATFAVDKDSLPETIKELTQTLPFSDLTVEDETIEEIIKNFFAREKQKNG